MNSGYKIVSAEIEGDGALVMHNGQTANPLNPYSKALKQVSGSARRSTRTMRQWPRPIGGGMVNREIP